MKIEQKIKTTHVQNTFFIFFFHKMCRGDVLLRSFPLQKRRLPTQLSLSCDWRSTDRQKVYVGGLLYLYTKRKTKNSPIPKVKYLETASTEQRTSFSFLVWNLNWISVEKRKDHSQKRERKTAAASALLLLYYLHPTTFHSNLWVLIAENKASVVLK